MEYLIHELFVERNDLFDLRFLLKRISLLNLLFVLLQATVGACNIPEPNSWKVVEHTKWKRFVLLSSPVLSFHMPT